MKNCTKMDIWFRRKKRYYTKEKQGKTHLKI